MWYRRKKTNRNWGTHHTRLPSAPVAGYNHFMQSLTTGPDGILHLIFQFHFAESGHAADCRGRRSGTLRIQKTVAIRGFNEDTRFDDPLTMETMRAICHDPQGGDGQHSVRVGNHVVDANNQPWFFCSYPRVSKRRIVASQPRGMGACGSIPGPQRLEHGRRTHDIAIPRSQRQIALCIRNTSAQKAV